MSSVKDLLRGDVVDGSGTANYVSKWSDADTITNSVIYDDGTNVGIGTSSPSSKIEVVGGASHGTGFTQTRSGHPSFSVLNGGTNSVYLGIAPDGGNYNTFMQVVEDGTDINYLRFNTGGSSERMRITGGGQVLMGTTTGITTSPRLQIEALTGGLQATFSRVGAYAETYMGGTTATATQFYVRSGGSGGVRLDYAATSWASASDINLKNVTSEISGALSKLENVRAVNFNWKDDEENKNNYGVIAQEVEAEFPELVSESSIDGMKAVKYTEFVPILIAAIKELKTEIESLKSQINV